LTTNNPNEYLVDLKYVDEKVFLIEKVGSDDFVGVLTSARFLCDNGIDIPAKTKSVKADPDAKSEDKVEKPEVKKKKLKIH
jgi:hypothetical protein